VILRSFAVGNALRGVPESAKGARLAADGTPRRAFPTVRSDGRGGLLSRREASGEHGNPVASSMPTLGCAE